MFQSEKPFHRHMKHHTNKDKFSCPVCQHTFDDSHDLKRHVRLHTGIKPFKCDHCDKAFVQRCSLEGHLTKKHGVKLSYKPNERRPKVSYWFWSTRLLMIIDRFRLFCKQIIVCENCSHTTGDKMVAKKHKMKCPALLWTKNPENNILQRWQHYFFLLFFPTIYPIVSSEHFEIKLVNRG